MARRYHAPLSTAFYCDKLTSSHTFPLCPDKERQTVRVLVYYTDRCSRHATIFTKIPNLPLPKSRPGSHMGEYKIFSYARVCFSRPLPLDIDVEPISVLPRCPHVTDWNRRDKVTSLSLELLPQKAGIVTSPWVTERWGTVTALLSEKIVSLTFLSINFHCQLWFSHRILRYSSRVARKVKKKKKRRKTNHISPENLLPAEFEIPAWFPLKTVLKTLAVILSIYREQSSALGVSERP